tara:strand:- start:100 stop:399 length:300 start_codon:yes stop_codon:yes gene_type:complete
MVTKGNVFATLGLEQADDLLFRAELLHTVTGIIRERKLTQAKAAALMNMDQPRVSALMNGKLSKFSAERLVQALNDLGLDVELRVTPAKSEKGQTTIAA